MPGGLGSSSTECQGLAVTSKDHPVRQRAQLWLLVAAEAGRAPQLGAPRRHRRWLRAATYLTGCVYCASFREASASAQRLRGCGGESRDELSRTALGRPPPHGRPAGSCHRPHSPRPGRCRCRCSADPPLPARVPRASRRARICGAAAAPLGQVPAAPRTGRTGASSPAGAAPPRAGGGSRSASLRRPSCAGARPLAQPCRRGPGGFISAGARRGAHLPRLICQRHPHHGEAPRCKHGPVCGGVGRAVLIALEQTHGRWRRGQGGTDPVGTELRRAARRERSGDALGPPCRPAGGAKPLRAGPRWLKRCLVSPWAARGASVSERAAARMPREGRAALRGHGAASLRQWRRGYSLRRSRFHSTVRQPRSVFSVSTVPSFPGGFPRGALPLFVPCAPDTTASSRCCCCTRQT